MFATHVKKEEWDEMKREGTSHKIPMCQMNSIGLTSSKSINHLGGFGLETYQHPSSIDVEEIYDSKLNSKVSKIN